VLAGLAPAFALAPRLLAACLEPAVIGVPFLLIEWREGVAVGGTLPAGFAPDAHVWLLPALAQALARLHALDPAALGLGDLGRASGFAERTLRGWTKRAAAAFASEAPPALGQLLGLLGRRLPAEVPARLLHMDAKFDNLLVDPVARAATALIDWDMGTLGPPAFDLAVLLSYWIEPGDPPGTHALAAVPSLLPGWPGRAEVVAAYLQAAGDAPPDLGWHLALARLRLSTAWMQLYRLWERGSLTGDRYAGFKTMAQAILAQAADRFGDI
jgi:aminoglycoside phosphotransferase (APT) family kinase protein